MPTVVEPPAAPFTDQVTAVFALPVTVAVKVWLAPNWTAVEAGATVTVTGGGGSASVTADCANAVVLATDVARMVMLEDAGIVEGAV